MTSKSYKKAFNEDKVINELKDFHGTHFDHDVLKIFIEKVLGKDQ
jgi:HD-GYP domain-containing protein (c-di-GMP phosphodiesterase class II)